ncbi:MAG: hypothetical protein D6768_19850 [Chloroflexi bacterium]|nr:MAG: hypothetical protein D6768_19850 [Chloroflexota bacterium]
MRFFAGFLTGLVMGFVAVLLTTPQSGQDLQLKARSRFDEIVAESRRAAAERRAELENRLADMKAGRPV